MRNINILMNARIPIIKFIDPDTKLNCDICLNNFLAYQNTCLIKEYFNIDDRCIKLIYFVFYFFFYLKIKFWSKKRELNEPYKGTLSSYAFVIM
jgi:DNA polymerase sigma